MSDVERVKQWLKTTWKLTVPEDWLSACVDWISSEHQVSRFKKLNLLQIENDFRIENRFKIK